MPEKRRPRGRPPLGDDPLRDYADDDRTPAALRRLADVAGRRGITWNTLCRLGDFDPSGLRRSFEVQSANKKTLRRIATTLGFDELVQRALCSELGPFAARETCTRSVRSAFPDKADTASADARGKIYKALLDIDEEKQLEYGTRLVLADYGLDELFRQHRFRSAIRDVVCELFADELTGLHIADARGLDDFLPLPLSEGTTIADALTATLDTMAISYSERTKIFQVLAPYTGPRFDLYSASGIYPHITSRKGART